MTNLDEGFMHIIDIRHNNVGLLTVCFDEKNIHIRESYTVADPKYMLEVISLIRKEAERFGIEYKRSDASWLREWKAHNMIYKMGLFKNNTAHVDLNENESWFRRLGYLFLSLFYRH